MHIIRCMLHHFLSLGFKERACRWWWDRSYHHHLHHNPHPHHMGTSLCLQWQEQCKGSFKRLDILFTCSQDLSLICGPYMRHEIFAVPPWSVRKWVGGLHKWFHFERRRILRRWSVIGLSIAKYKIAEGRRTGALIHRDEGDYKTNLWRIFVHDKL